MMISIIRVISVVCLLSIHVAGAEINYTSDPTMTEEIKGVLIIGSTEHPDPILEMVRDLEKKGILRDVVVMESFPVQIRVTGPKNIIESLQSMPRKASPRIN